MYRKIQLLVLLLLFCGGVVRVYAAENIIAKVGEVAITRFELQREINKIMPMLVSFHGKATEEKQLEIQQKAYDNLIVRGYKVCSALKHKMLVPEAEVTKLIENARKSLTQEQFERAIAAETLPGLRASIGRQLLSEAAEKKFVDAKISVQSEAVAAYYAENKSGYFRPQQFRASHILVKVDPALSQEDKDILKVKAEGLLEGAKNNEDFYNLAYYNSDDRTKYVGGDLGLFHAGQTVPEFETALQTLKVGEISGLVKTLYGYHIIKLTEKNPPRQLLFAEVAEKIKKQLEEKQRVELYTAWLDSLSADCPVEKFPF